MGKKQHQEEEGEELLKELFLLWQAYSVFCPKGPWGCQGLPGNDNGMAWSCAGDVLQCTFILRSFLSQTSVFEHQMPVEWELIRLACVETDAVLSGAAKIQYQILTSFIMYSFLMQGTQLVLEEDRFGYDSA